MFRIDQILSATTFIRSFREVADRLSAHPEPLLITTRDGRFIVIMDGDFFEGIMDARSQLPSMRTAPQNNAPKTSHCAILKHNTPAELPGGL
jgi:hypothetical protein